MPIQLTSAILFARGAWMAGLGVISKLNTLVLVPVFLLTLANSVIIYYVTSSEVILATYLILFGIALTFIGIVLRRKGDLLEKELNEIYESLKNVHLTACTLKKELSCSRNDSMEDVYSQLMYVLQLSRQEASKAGEMGRGHIPVAKELGKLCARIGQVSHESGPRAGAQEVLILESLIKQTAKLNQQLASQNEDSEVEKILPLKSGSLRRAIKMADSRAA